MDLRIFVEPQQGATYDQQLQMAQRSEALGFDGFFRSDHYLHMSGDGLPGPTDSWVTLGAIAQATSQIRLGTLVTSATFRHPGVLAISAAQVDNMSGGRVELGLGAGWFDGEHQAYGIPFPGLGERFDRLTEQLEIITGLWATPETESFHWEGPVWPISDSPARPAPTQPGGPPIIIGGHGPKRTPRLAARFAAEFNVPFAGVDDTNRQLRIVDDACASIDRDPGSMVHSVAQVVCCGATAAEVDRRAAAIGRETEELRTNGLTGSPEELVTKLAEFAAVGVTRVYLQVLDIDDLEHIELIAGAVLPEARGLA
ncbi:MAG: TIGR03560 family F420-dependent LLM class oxidoreductase [Actinomycetes bacterium]